MRSNQAENRLPPCQIDMPIAGDRFIRRRGDYEQGDSIQI
jgi:hypothetical protein